MMVTVTLHIREDQKTQLARASKQETKKRGKRTTVAQLHREALDIFLSQMFSETNQSVVECSSETDAQTAATASVSNTEAAA